MSPRQITKVHESAHGMQEIHSSRCQVITRISGHHSSIQ